MSPPIISAQTETKSVAINIAKPEGRDLILQLAKKSDVLVENFRPASLRKLKLTYDDLAAVNERLIVCSISGYGRGHALEDRPGYDFVIQAESGFMSITGEQAGAPMRLGVAFIDLVTGMNAAQAILAALFMRERTGKGQWLDISLTDSAHFMLANVASGYLNTGDEPKRYGNAHPSIVPYQLFDCADGRIALAVGNDEQFRRFCAVIGRPEIALDARFATNRSRTEFRTDLIGMLEGSSGCCRWSSSFRTCGRRVFQQGDVRSVGQAFGSEVAGMRETVITVPSARLGNFEASAIHFACPKVHSRCLPFLPKSGSIPPRYCRPNLACRWLRLKP